MLEVGVCGLSLLYYVGFNNLVVASKSVNFITSSFLLFLPLEVPICSNYVQQVNFILMINCLAACIHSFNHPTQLVWENLTLGLMNKEVILSLPLNLAL